MADYSEWLEADGLGGFASGTSTGVRTRRYHALLLVATTPPTGRCVLVNGCDAEVRTAQGSFALTSQRYGPDVIHPDGTSRIASFSAEPFPRWIYRLADGTRIEHTIFVPRDAPAVVVAWTLLDRRAGVTLDVRPFLSGRDYHALHHANSAARLDADVQGQRVSWHPYGDLPAVQSLANATYAHQPDWYRNFLYTDEQARGLDCTEDLMMPGVLTWNLSRGPAVWVLTTDPAVAAAVERGGVAAYAARVRAAEEKRRAAFPTRLHRAADAYIVRRGVGKTVVAGYPWFTDWGRDTFIALRGLCLATGRLVDACDILVRWASAVSQGMLPNRFTDQGETPEFNSVDAALWYVVAVFEFLAAAEKQRCLLDGGTRGALLAAVEAILTGFAGGTRYRIGAEADGLLAAGEPGVQLTWMDAKVGDWVVTPRIGKPVEIQALWLNALALASEHSPRWADLYARGRDSFQRRFWNAGSGYLYDVIDVEHRSGAVDPSFRPNQIFAVGGLPIALIDGERARRIVDAVEQRLWTPLGLRSLAPSDPNYVGHYQGGPHDRDAAYHQGTVWPWLLGAFVDAWLRVRGHTGAAKREARARFLQPLLDHLDQAGLGHVSEIADGDPPHTPRGCPFQAWSVGEALRLSRETEIRQRQR